MAGTGPWTILIAEDDVDIRRFLVIAFEGGGHTVITAQNGVEALELLKTRGGEVDFVISDYEMPGMDGVALLTTVAKHWEHIHRIFMTAESDDEPFRRCPKGTVCFHKPVMITSIEAAMLALVGNGELPANCTRV